MPCDLNTILRTQHEPRCLTMYVGMMFISFLLCKDTTYLILNANKNAIKIVVK